MGRKRKKRERWVPGTPFFSKPTRKQIFHDGRILEVTGVDSDTVIDKDGNYYVRSSKGWAEMSGGNSPYSDRFFWEEDEVEVLEFGFASLGIKILVESTPGVYVLPTIFANSVPLHKVGDFCYDQKGNTYIFQSG